MYDIVIRNGKILDGAGSPWYYGDIGIAGNLIVHIGPAQSLLHAEARTAIDAGGRFIAPGFIDIHSHSDFTVLQCPGGDSKIFQGVTTELTGHCGYSLAPVNETYLEGLKLFTAFMPGRLDWSWRSEKQFHDAVERARPSINFLSLIGHGALQISVMGFENRPASPRELAAMKDLLDGCLAEGAAGLSLGLAYPPGSFTNQAELTELAKVVRSRGKLLTSHIRDESDTVEESLREMLNIARETGVRLEICHLKTQGKRNWGRMDALFDQLETARRDGVDVTFDVYPYTKLNTLLTALLPVWAQDGGVSGMVDRMKDGRSAALILEQVEPIANRYGGWENIVVASCSEGKNRWCEGLSLAEIGEREGLAPAEAFMRLMIGDNCGVMAVCNCLNEENLQRALRHPLGMLCSDGKILTKDGVLAQGKPHPRNYGAFVRFLTHYVRDERIMTLEDAIRRMTSFPAQRLGLKNRGQLRVGDYADIVMFDLNRLRDRATFLSPQHYAEGMDAVIVNGSVTVKDGEHQNVFNGRVIRQ